MSEAGIKKLKNPNDQYGGIDESDNTKPRFYDSSNPTESKRITKNIGNNASDSTNYQCVCDDPDKIGIYGVTFDETTPYGTSEGLSSSTFCRCPRDGAKTATTQTPFHSIKSSDKLTLDFSLFKTCSETLSTKIISGSFFSVIRSIVIFDRLSSFIIFTISISVSIIYSSFFKPFINSFNLSISEFFGKV